MVVTVLVGLLVIAGMIYTWYMGQRVETGVLSAEVTTPRRGTLPPPPQVDPNAPVGVYIQTLSSPVVPGSNAAVSVRTQPEADCTIKVTYHTTLSTDSGLAPKQSDEYGIVGWSWTVEAEQPLGSWPIDITCTRNKRSGYMRGNLVLVKQLP